MKNYKKLFDKLISISLKELFETNGYYRVKRYSFHKDEEDVTYIISFQASIDRFTIHLGVHYKKLIEILSSEFSAVSPKEAYECHVNNRMSGLYNDDQWWPLYDGCDLLSNSMDIHEKLIKYGFKWFRENKDIRDIILNFESNIWNFMSSIFVIEAAYLFFNKRDVATEILIKNYKRQIKIRMDQMDQFPSEYIESVKKDILNIKDIYDKFAKNNGINLDLNSLLP